MVRNALRDIEDLPDVGITMSDGTRLSARIWRPVDAGDDPVPAILEYLPYRKRDGTTGRDALTHPWFARRGYAGIRVDMRGNGDSHGLMQDEYTQQELDDAVEVIDWLAAQPWCNGNVGMMGISWGGFNGLQVAAMAPEALKAVITLCSTVDRFADDIHYKGGCLLNENLGWGATMWCYSSRAPDPALREDWREIWLDRLENEPFLPALWLRHQRRDDYWRHGSVCEDFGAIKARVLAVGGWGDGYKNAVPQLVENLAPTAKGIVGPWVHKYPHFAVPEPRIGFLQEALRWWDRWLKGLPNGAEDDPAYRAYVMDGVRPAAWYDTRPGSWIAEAEGTGGGDRQVWALSCAGDAGRTLTGLERTESDGADAQFGAPCSIRSPQTCGMAAGEYCAIWLGPEMPGDQRRDDALSLCFDSAPLPEDLPILGAPRLRLRLASDRPQAQIAVRLTHLHPDGAATRITYGLLNLAHRDGPAEPRPMAPGEACDIRLDLDHVGYRVPAGHRLRVAISTAYWPLVWPSPDAAELTLSGGALELPLRAASGDECAFPPPESDAPWQVETLREERHVRRIEEDLVSGEVHLVIEDDFGRDRDLEHGLESGTIGRERWSIRPDDPLSARGETHWTAEMGREDWQLRTETFARMWCDATHFHLWARLEGYENDRLVYERDIEDSIARDNL